VVEHCTGPLGVGTVVVKPLRHCLHFWELHPAESAELGALLQEVAEVIQSLLAPDQVYVCLWSHGSWQPQHLHFVMQPVWQHLKERFAKPEPHLQAAMFASGDMPERRTVEAFCEQARRLMHQGTLRSVSETP